MTDNPVVLAYCAGIFDGEGFITIRRWLQKRIPARYNRIRHELQLGVNQVRPEAVQVMHEALGGRIYFSARGNGRYAKYSGRWSWDIDSGKAAACLQVLRPYLRIKHVEADIAIRFQATKMSHTTGRAFKSGLTEEERVFRDWCYHELKRLKRLHYDPNTVKHYEILYTELKVKPC